LPELEPGRIRVAMSLAPVNPSDLIPITGADAHRLRFAGRRHRFRRAGGDGRGVCLRRIRAAVGAERAQQRRRGRCLPAQRARAGRPGAGKALLGFG